MKKLYSLSKILSIFPISICFLLTTGTAFSQDKNTDKAQDKSAATGKPALTVSIVKPTSQVLAQSIAANGSLAAWQEASVSAEVTGLRLIELNANVGDTVTKGQVLARFSQDTLNAEIAATRAQVADAQAAADEAKSNGQRARDMEKTGFYSQQAISQWLNAEKSASARLEAAKANLSLQDLRLKNTAVRAPDDGVITSRTAVIGSVLAPGVELFRMIRQGRLEWRAELTTAELTQVKKGSMVQIEVAGNASKVVAGKVRQIAPVLDSQTRNAIVYVDISNADVRARDLKAGQFLRGSFAGLSKSSLTVPSSAIVMRDGFSYVFVLTAQTKVAQTKVTVGQRTGNTVEITSGLKSDTAVVATGAAFLADGDLVKVVTQ